LDWIGFDKLSPKGRERVPPALMPFALSLSKGIRIKLARCPEEKEFLPR